MTIAPSVRLRIDLGDGGSIGPGKIALLEYIERSGSLSKAARALSMSYRRAWLLLDDLNHSLAAPVTTASIGGSGGGGARLTDFGRQVVAAYREVEQAAAELAAQRLAWLAAAVPAEAPATGTRRPINRPLARGKGKPEPDRAAAGGPPQTRGRAAKRP